VICCEPTLTPAEKTQRSFEYRQMLGAVGCGVDLVVVGAADAQRLAGSRWHVMGGCCMSPGQHAVPPPQRQRVSSFTSIERVKQRLETAFGALSRTSLRRLIHSVGVEWMGVSVTTPLCSSR